MCTVNQNAVSHVFEKRDTGEKYKGGAKAGEVKLTAALLPGEYRTAVATVPDPRGTAGETMQARLPVYYMRFKDKGDFGTLSTFVTREREAVVKRTSTVEQ
eukprot:994090-Prymnesium_polylepis.1